MAKTSGLPTHIIIPHGPFSPPSTLSTTPGPLLLSRIFQSFGCFCRFVGILPISVNADGTATFSFFSRPFLINTLAYVIIFLGTLSIYLPAAINLFSSIADPALAIAENLFIGGQLLGVILTILQIPLIATRFVLVWNGLRDVVDFIASRNLSSLYRQPYIRSRVAFIAYLNFMVIYAIICWRDFANRITTVKKSEDPFRYWTNAVLLVVFFISTFFHLLPFFLFKMFAVIMIKSFIGLETILKERCKEGVVIAEKSQSPSHSELKELIKVYENLVALGKGLGKALGLYLLVEMVVLMTSLLMTVFTMLSQFQQRDIYSTVFCFFSYAVLLVVLTETGEHLGIVGKRCLENLRDAVYSGSDHEVDAGLMHKVATLKPPKLSAAGFFYVNRTLSVAMGSTFATYFVVILQFKLNTFAK